MALKAASEECCGEALGANQLVASELCTGIIITTGCTGYAAPKNCLEDLGILPIARRSVVVEILQLTTAEWYTALTHSRKRAYYPEGSLVEEIGSQSTNTNYSVLFTNCTCTVL